MRRIVGTAILLCSWISQTLLYDYWNGRDSDLKQAESTYLSVLASTFVINAVTNQTKNEEAGYDWAEETFELGLNQMILSLPQPDREKYSERLSHARVEDKMNEFGAELMHKIEDEEKSINLFKRIFRWIFVATYLVGSILLLSNEYKKIKDSVNVRSGA